MKTFDSVEVNSSLTKISNFYDSERSTGEMGEVFGDQLKQ